MLGVHDEVDGAATGTADVTTVAVAGDREGKGRMGVVVKGTKGFMATDFQTERISDGLDGQILQFLNIEFRNHTFCSY